MSSIIAINAVRSAKMVLLPEDILAVYFEADAMIVLPKLPARRMEAPIERRTGAASRNAGGDSLNRKDR